MNLQSKIILRKINYAQKKQNALNVWIFLENATRDILQYYNLFNNKGIAIQARKETINMSIIRYISKTIGFKEKNPNLVNEIEKIWKLRCQIAHINYHKIKLIDFFAIFAFIQYFLIQTLKEIYSH